MSDTEALVLKLDGFEGPLDLLLALARAEKLDLSRISILALVEQYLSVIEGARRVRLELAADWLVMAAWLAWLKSRLLLPAGHPEADEALTAADALAERLAELDAMRAAAVALDARPMLGRDVFGRGMPVDFAEVDRSRLVLDVPGLVRAYLTALRRGGLQRSYKVEPLGFWTVQQALERLAGMLGHLRAGENWLRLEELVPPAPGPIQQRAAVAGTLLAGLELARDGAALLRQERAFGPIHLRGAGA